MASLGRREEDVVRLQSEDDLRTYIETLAGHGPQHEAVIEIDRDDDLTSVRSKLEGIRVPRAVLVIPTNVKVLRDGLEFRVLRRLQRELGLDLIVVSNDLNRRAFAQENGFRNVFNSLRAYYRSKDSAPDDPESVPFTDPQEFSPALSIGKWGIAVAATLLTILGALAYLAVPVATVVVYPETQSMVRDVEILVEIGGPRMDITAQRLSGRVVEERVQVEGSIDVRAIAGETRPARDETSQPSGFQPGTNVTLQVRDALRERMLRQATAQGEERLRTQLKSNESIPDASIRTEITGERYNHNIGDVAETLGGSLEVVTAGIGYNNDDFYKLVRALWSQDIPRDYGAVGEAKLDPPSVVSSEVRHVTLRVRTSGTIQRAVDTDGIAAAVRGMTLPEAQRLVAGTGDFARPPQIGLWPDWATRAFRVQVKTAVDPAPTAKESSQ